MNRESVFHDALARHVDDLRRHGPAADRMGVDRDGPGGGSGDAMTKTYESDETDRRRVMAAYGPALGRCAGGRIIWPGYVCVHCNSRYPTSECGAPQSQASQK